MVVPVSYRNNICIGGTRAQIYLIISPFKDNFFLITSTLNKTGSQSNKIPLKLISLGLITIFSLRSTWLE